MDGWMDEWLNKYRYLDRFTGRVIIIQLINERKLNNDTQQTTDWHKKWSYTFVDWNKWANQGQFKQEWGGQVASDTVRVKFKSVVPANLSDQV